jgi:uncharacterized protein YdhG (YjbR/CyaY superfamily)
MVQTSEVNNINTYIKMFPQNIRSILTSLRQTINESAPNTIETISYKIPTFKLNNKILLYFAAYKNHIGFYPTPTGIDAFKEDLSPYVLFKSTIKFPIDYPLPLKLIRNIVKFRVR